MNVEDKNDVKFKPMHHRILVHYEEIERKTPSGIIIPAMSNDQSVHKGEIIAISDDITLDYKVGDIVLFDPSTMKPIYYHEKATKDNFHFVTHENNIIGKYQ